MRSSLRAFLAAASAVYAAGAVSAQPPTHGFSGNQFRQAAASQPSGIASSPPTITSTFLNTPQFGIPFSVDAMGTQPVEVQLFVSRDGGAQWEFIGRQPAGSREFPFRATADGDYWFATRTIDAAGAAHPAGPVAPQLRVTVDTANPQLEAQVEADANGGVTVHYRVSDASPQADGVRLEYMTDAVRQWMPVQAASQPTHRPSENALEGQIAWQPESEWRHVQVRMYVRDRAGNQTTLTRQVERPRIAQQPFQLASKPLAYPAPEAPFAQAPASLPQAAPLAAAAPAPTAAAPNPQEHEGYAPERFASNQLRGLDLSGPGLNTPAMSGPAGGSFGTGEVTRNDPTIAPMERSRHTDASDVPSASSARSQAAWSQADLQNTASDPSTSPAPRTIENATRPLPIEQIPSPTPQAVTAPQPNTSAGGEEAVVDPTLTTPEPDGSVYRKSSIRLVDQLPQGSLIRRSNTRTFSLDYEVDAVGSQGVDAVELWCTKDGGKTWKYWDKDPDRQSPFDIMTADEGLYGFRMVVVGGNGLTSPRPMPGDNADIYVLIDTVAPEPRITGARYGEGDQTGNLLIDFRCDETNETLAGRPIRLAFAEDLDGPWTTIATGLDNNGQYVWPADPQLPQRIYLRIEATDKAGNVGTDTLETPIDVQGLAPRARIRGFQPVAEAALRDTTQTR